MQTSRFSSLSAKLTVVICGLVLTGCGGKPATVTGVVTLDGQPLQRGMIGFAPVSGGMKAAGMIKPKGNYSLKTNKEMGLDIGDYLVTVSSREPSIPDPNGGPPRPGKYITPRRYAVAKTSGLKYSVEKGSNEIDIELSSEGGSADAQGGRRHR